MRSAVQGEATSKELRSFAFLVGGALVVLWAYRAFAHGRWSIVLIAIAFICFALGAFYSHILQWPYRAWMRVGEHMGAVVSWVLLSIFFYLILTPIALIHRLFVRDPLELRIHRGDRSYFHEKHIQVKAQFERMF